MNAYDFFIRQLLLFISHNSFKCVFVIFTSVLAVILGLPISRNRIVIFKFSYKTIIALSLADNIVRDKIPSSRSCKTIFAY